MLLKFSVLSQKPNEGQLYHRKIEHIGEEGGEVGHLPSQSHTQVSIRFGGAIALTISETSEGSSKAWKSEIGDRKRRQIKSDRKTSPKGPHRF